MKKGDKMEGKIGRGEKGHTGHPEHRARRTGHAAIESC